MPDDRTHVLEIKFATPDYPAGHLEIIELDGRERISELFRFDLLVAARDSSEVAADALIGSEATLTFERDGKETRRVDGMIVAVTNHIELEAIHSTFRLTFVPRVHALTLIETLDVFLDSTVPDIIRGRLVESGFREGIDFELRLHDQYPSREFTVQYKETDAAFISRLTEHLGISFFFEHSGDHEVLVFTDHNDGFRPISGGDVVPLRPRGDLRDVYRIEERVRLIPGQYVVQDYNYRTPQVALTGKADVATGLGRVVEYGAHVKTPKEAEALAHVRAQEQLSSRKVFEGTADVERFAAGAHCRIDNPSGDDIELLLTEVRHKASQPRLGSSNAKSTYANEFFGIRAAVHFRPPRVTPRPRIGGVVTGVIDAESRGQYAEIDDQGRYRVKFLFDTTAPSDGKGSRLVRMAQPHAGAGYGMHFPLRPGVEVILTFVDGDPDRPIIAATVPNPQTASPVQSGNAPKNIIRTGSGNEMHLDDTQGSERIKLSTPHKNTTFQLGAPNSPERGAMLETEGASSNVAFSGMAGFTSLHTTFSAIQHFLSSGDITTIAEKPDFAEGVTGVGEIVQAMIETASAGVEIAQSIREQHLAALKLASIKAQAAAKAEHEKALESRKTAQEKLDELRTADPDPETEELIKAYEEAQENYASAMQALMSNQEFLRDSNKGEAAGSMLGEIDMYEVAVEDNQKALDSDDGLSVPAMGATARLAAARAALEAMLAAKQDGDPGKEEAAGVTDALDGAAEDEAAMRTTWDGWNDEANPMRQYDVAAEEAETGDEALDLKEAKTRLAEAGAGATILFSVAAQIVTLVKWILHRIRSKITFTEYMSERWKAKGRTLIKHTPWLKRDMVKHTLGSKGDVEIDAKKHLHIHAKDAVLTSDNTTIAGIDTLHLHGTKDVEIATPSKLSVTVAKIDVLTTSDVKEIVGGKVSATVARDIEVMATTGNIKIETTPVPAQSILVKSGKVTLNAADTATVLSAAWKLEVKGASGVKLGNPTWQLALSDTGVVLGTPMSRVAIKQDYVRVANGPSAVKVAAAAVEISSTGSVKISGANLQLG